MTLLFQIGPDAFDQINMLIILSVQIIYDTHYFDYW